MASITASHATPRTDGSRWAAWLVTPIVTIAVGMFIVGALVQSMVAGEHGQFHALFASVFLVPALVLAARHPRGGPASTPAIIGLTAAAIAQLIEGVGGFGYGPGNVDRINALASVHDVGLALSPIGLVAAVVGLTLGVARVRQPRFGRWPALVLAVAVLVSLGVLVAKLIGL